MCPSALEGIALMAGQLSASCSSTEREESSRRVEELKAKHKIELAEALAKAVKTAKSEWAASVAAMHAQHELLLAQVTEIGEQLAAKQRLAS